MGRITTYVVLGIVFGAIGFSIQVYRVFQILSIVLGILLIILAWRKHWIKYIEFRKLFFNRWLNNSMGNLLRKRGFGHLFLLGMMNGILPCGMIFVALASSLLAPTIWGSASAMLFYGLGTLPSMILVGFFAHSMGNTFRSRMSKAFPYMMTVIGILVILRGANLGIPYLSPMIVENKNATHVEGNEPKTVQVMCHTPSQQKQQLSEE